MCMYNIAECGSSRKENDNESSTCSSTKRKNPEMENEETEMECKPSARKNE